MNKKSLILLAVGVLVVSLLGLGGLWFLLGDKSSDVKKQAVTNPAPEQETAKLTSIVELFQINMPCKRNAQGNTPVVHTDLQLLVPIKYRIKAEESMPRIRDIIGTILRNSEINDINSDNLVGFKKQLIAEIDQQLGIKVQEVLVLHYDYDVMRQRH